MNQPWHHFISCFPASNIAVNILRVSFQLEAELSRQSSNWTLPVPLTPPVRACSSHQIRFPFFFAASCFAALVQCNLIGLASTLYLESSFLLPNNSCVTVSFFLTKESIHSIEFGHMVLFIARRSKMWLLLIGYLQHNSRR